MTKNNLWHLMFLFFMVADDGNELMQLLYAEDFDEAFDELTSKIQGLYAEDFKANCLRTLIDKKQVIADLNKAYREVKSGNEGL
jgi:hypothetical protein